MIDCFLPHLPDEPPNNVAWTEFAGRAAQPAGTGLDDFILTLAGSPREPVIAHLCFARADVAVLPVALAHAGIWSRPRREDPSRTQPLLVMRYGTRKDSRVDSPVSAGSVYLPAAGINFRWGSMNSLPHSVLFGVGGVSPHSVKWAERLWAKRSQLSQNATRWKVLDPDPPAAGRWVARAIVLNGFEMLLLGRGRAHRRFAYCSETGRITEETE